MSETEEKRHQQKVGKVISDKMQKTIVVAVEMTKNHRIYKRAYKQTKTFKAHDEHNQARTGDLVKIEETRPLSKDKRWRLVQVIAASNQDVPVAEAAVADTNLE